MIERLSGTVVDTHEKGAVIVVNGIGFNVSTPATTMLQQGETCDLFTYMHWMQDKGPRLFGFSKAFDRTVFLLIIECPNIGPSIALNILSRIPAYQFV